MNIKTKDKKIIIILVLSIFIIALLPRLIIISRAINIPPQDTDGYEALATNIMNYGEFSSNGRLTSLHEPFYPFFLASIYYFLGHSYMAAEIIQAVLGALTCIIIFLISINLFPLPVAIVAALVSCFNPGFIKSSTHLMTENLYTFLFVVAIYFLIRQTKEGGFKNLIFSGITLGIAALTRSATLLFPIFILFFIRKKLTASSYSAKRYILSIVIFIFFFSVTILPWTLRNWRVHHRFVPICTKGGLALYCAYDPPKDKLAGLLATSDTFKRSELMASEMDKNDFLVKETLKFIKNNPLKVLKLGVLKIAFFWSLFDWEIIGYGVYNFMYGFILPFFIYGIFITARRFAELLPVYLPIFYSFLITLLIYGSPRFRLPIEPYLIVIASAGIVHFVLRFSNKIYGFLLTAIYFILNLFLYFNSYQTKLFVKSIFEKIHLW